MAEMEARSLMRPRISKLPYYARSASVLSLQLRRGSRLRALAPRGPIQFRSGLSFEVSGLLDLLILKETIYDDVYGLDGLEGAEPELIIDLGAGIGSFSILAASKFPSATVLAFEPNPPTFALLQANVSRNEVPNVKLYPLAVGTRESYRLRCGTQSATASAWADSGSKRDKLVEVRGSPLDPFVPAGDVDLLKIDVEGGEIDVLESLSTSLSSRVKRFAIEYHGHLVEGSSSTVARMLREWGLVVTVTPDRYNPAIGYVFARSSSL
jgi:FkbM family methyltransferase